MASPPLERDRQAEIIRKAIASAAISGGVFVTIEGPAGIGKSTLLEYVRETSGRPILVGLCDDLAIPQSLGPFEDLAREMSELDEAIGSGAHAIRRFLLELLGDPTAPVLAIEDLHWGDQSTLDVLAFVGRRLDQIRSPVVITFRTGSAAENRVIRLLSQIPSDRLIRVELAELSLESIDRLASSSKRDPHDLLVATGGNPFLVSEMLASDDPVPRTVADSVAARLGVLPADAQEAAKLLAAAAGEVEWSVIDALISRDSMALADLELEDLVSTSENGVGFRHELLKEAVSSGISAVEMRDLHHRLLAASLDNGASPSHIAHHAAGAGDLCALLEYSEIAARVASRAGAHVEALSHLENVLAHLDELPERKRAGIMEMAAGEFWFNQRLPESLQAALSAAELWANLDEPLRAGAMLNHASRVELQLAQRERSDELLDRSLALLTAQPPSQELALALISRGQHLALSARIPEAIEVLDNAVDSAEKAGDALVLGKAYSAREPWRLALGDGDGRNDGDKAIEILTPLEAHDQLSTLLGNRIASGLNTLDLGHLEDDLAQAQDLANAIDSMNLELMIAGQSARIALHRGYWDEADSTAELVLETVGDGVRRCTALTVRTALAARRGRDDATTHLDELVSLSRSTNDIQRLGPAASVAGEMTWLGMVDRREFIEEIQKLAERSQYFRWEAETTIWLRRIGIETSARPKQAPTPLWLELEGDPAAGAREWRRIGFDFEAALCLTFSKQPELMVEAAETFDDLGAIASRDKVRQMLRDLGVTRRRGKSRTTRANPAGITERQMEVLELVTDGLTDAEIADRLFISPKTVGHHVSALLAKLGASTRFEAAEWLLEVRADPKR